MRAIQIKSPGADFELVTIPVPVPAAGEVLIKVEACGVCHGDLVVKSGHFPGIRYPIIPGHEIVGTVRKTGPGVNRFTVGQRVGVGWYGSHCNQCASCLGGDFTACENAEITGIHRNGGYAEYTTAREEAMVLIPDELSATEAAPLVCAGRTTFGALSLSGARGGDLVAIQGMGGLGHLALQYAVKLGFKTVLISRDPDKEDDAIHMGAFSFINTSRQNAAEELQKLGGARLILCLAPDSKSIEEILPGLGRRGEAVIISAPPAPMAISPLMLLEEERRISAYKSGSMEDALQFSVLTRIIPTVEVFALEDAAKAFDKMMKAKVKYRAVLKMNC